MPNRNASLDAFRCLLMLLIVVYHAAAYGIYGGEGAPMWLGLAFGTFIIWHVDGFVALSGWFGVKFSLARFLKIWGLILFYSLVSFAITGKVSFTGGWFAGAYLALMFLSPILNPAVEVLAKLSRRKCWTTWGIVSLGMLLNNSPFDKISAINSGGGVFSAMTLLYVYITMRLVKLTGVYEKMKKVHMLYVLGIYLLGSLVFSAIPALYLYHRFGVESLSQQVWVLYANYQTPHVVLMAVALLIYFEKFVRLPNWLAKLSVYLAPSMFSVYLLHTSCVAFGRQLFLAPQIWIHKHTTIWALWEIVFSGLLCFCICVTIDVVRRCVLKAPCAWLTSCIRRADERLGLV